MSAEVTIVHVPRERYSESQNSLESIIQHSGEVSYDLMILDAASPPPIADYLRETAKDNGRLLRFEHLLTPNELRNEVIERIDTPYIVFIDNDAVTALGWLPPLLNAAKEHDAWVVGPTILIGALDDGMIHLGGGDCGITENGGKRYYSYLQQHFCNRRLSEVRDQLKPGPCTCIECHCMLVRRDLFDRIGSLDKGLMSFVECDDFNMKVTEAGGLIYYAPESLVTYLPPRDRIMRADLEFFLLRWSDEWNERSLNTFIHNWRLAPEHKWVGHARSWPKTYRRYVLKQMAWPLGQLAGIIQHRLWSTLGDALANLLEARYTNDVRRRRLEGLKQRSSSSGKGGWG